MGDWKEAWQLTKIELKTYLWWNLLGAIFFIVAAALLGIGFPYYMDNNPLLEENNPGLYDIGFIAMFWVVPYWIRPKEFRYQAVSSDFWVTPYFIKLMQLPIPDSVIIKHRFLSQMFIVVPYHVLFLILFYLFSGLTGTFMSPVTFVVFAVIWMSFSIYAGHLYTASDAGDRISPFKMVLLFIVMGGVGLLVYLWFSFYSPYSAVEWTVLFATEWPILSSVISIVLAFLGLRYWMYHMKKTMNKLDYLYG